MGSRPRFHFSKSRLKYSNGSSVICRSSWCSNSTARSGSALSQSPGSFLKLPRHQRVSKEDISTEAEQQNNYPNPSQKCHGSKLNQPAKGRNDPASGTRLRPHEKRGIFLRTNPIPTSYCGLVWKKNADLRRFWWLGHFDHCWLVCGDR
jgi:hypothetical protein